MGETHPVLDGPLLGAGRFYGAIQCKHEQCDAIFTDLCHASPRKLPSHAHELPFFELILDGQYGESYRRQNRQFRPFTAIFRPRGVPHQDEIGPRGVTLFEIELRPRWRELLEDCSAHLDHGREDCAGGELMWLCLRLYRKLHDTGADGLEVESLLSELLASVARMPSERMPVWPAWLSHVIERLNADFARTVTLDELSREAGVHPVHLSRVFRKSKGQGIGDYVHRLRIRAACEQMRALETPIAEIGLATGFADQSHFTRSFRRVTGMTPAAFRGQLLNRRKSHNRQLPR